MVILEATFYSPSIIPQNPKHATSTFETVMLSFFLPPSPLALAGLSPYHRRPSTPMPRAPRSPLCREFNDGKKESGPIYIIYSNSLNLVRLDLV